MLKAWPENGLPMQLVGLVMEAFPQDPPIPVAVLRYATGPLVVHVSHKKDAHDLGWLGRDTLALWRPRVDIERLEILCGERPDIVSPTEIWLVMYNATMDASLQHQITQIYLWAAMRAYTAAQKQFPADLYNTMGGGDGAMPMPTDEQVFDGYLHDEYAALCRAIITKVVAAGRERSRTSRKPAR